MKVERRRLSFKTLEEAVEDAEFLLQSGYFKTGNWDLSQCCRHLARVMQYPIDGFPDFPLPMRVAMLVLRYSVAPGLLKRMLAAELWPERIPTDKDSVPKADSEDLQGIAEFRVAVNRLLTFNGPLYPSPLLGMLDKPTLIRLHRIHSAHHLGFLVPRTANEKVQRLSSEHD